MKLKQYLSKEDFSNKLVDINNKFEIASVSISFWGSRKVSIKGIKGSVSIDRIANQLLNTEREDRKEGNLTLQNRNAGIELAHKVINFYEISDSLVKEKNWFTRLLIAIREYSFLPYTSRFYLETTDLANDFFKGKKI